MKNIYFIGTNQKGWLEFYIKKVMYPVLDRYSVHILTERTEQDCPEYCDEIKIRELNIHGKNRLKKIINWWRDAKSYQRTCGYPDICHVQFVCPSNIFFHYWFWRRAKRRILTFWGSDLLRASRGELKRLRPFLRQATQITLSINTERDYFESIYGKRYEKKITVLDFGSPVFDEMDHILPLMTKEECKKEFGLSAGKLSVHIGYSGREAQQHLKIMEQLVNLPKECLNAIQFVFHFVYGEKEYQQKLEELLRKYSLDYIILTDYLDVKTMAVFRLTCDLFIYGQTTDAMSASPLEYLYGGADFLCPDYLRVNYTFLEMQGILYTCYKEFADLPAIVSAWVSRGPIVEEGRIELIRQSLSENLKWEKLAPKWHQLYE